MIIDYHCSLLILTMHGFPHDMTRSKQDKVTLKDWCRRFGLHYSGNKTALKNELRAFNRNQTAWDRYVMPFFLLFSLSLFLKLLFILCLIVSFLELVVRIEVPESIAKKRHLKKSPHISLTTSFPANGLPYPMHQWHSQHRLCNLLPHKSLTMRLTSTG